ncbi:hypothetical protein AK964_05390 [Clostridium butyricum]|nr:hypothetical protein AK964_05390 [Clostridium butyricum]
MSNFWSHKDYEKIREIDKEVIKKNKGIFSERKLRIINDNERWFYMYKSPFNMNNEKCIITISQEVTLNKKNGEFTRRSNRKLFTFYLWIL